MKRYLCLMLLVCGVVNCQAQSRRTVRLEAEYYVDAYARQYQMPALFVRAIVEQESNWRPCAISSKGAAGLMQLMPLTASRLGVTDRCNVRENIAGGIRYLAWLRQMFGGDLRLVAAAYLAGETVIARRGLLYRNPEVVAYVSGIRKRCQRQLAADTETSTAASRRRTIR
jgi:soluble lytic murein transglycosylase-like protein